MRFNLYLVLLSLFEYSNGFWIDPSSCAQYTNYIMEKMPNAVAFLTTTNTQMANFGGDQQNDNVFDLAKLLFHGGNPNATGSDLDTVEEAKKTYNGIVTSGALTVSTAPDTIRIFCNTDRLSQVAGSPSSNPNESTWHDSVNNFNFTDGGNPQVKTCPQGFRAYTVSPDDKSYSVITICPSVLEEASNQAWSANTQAELLATAHTLANMDAGNFVINGVAQPRIDTLIFSIFPMENLLTHTFMHTVDAGGAQDAEGAESYQWNNILRISGLNATAINAASRPEV
ncbi:hypothetical protein V8E54_010984 [Elaphomyces granulatus]